MSKGLAGVPADKPALRERLVATLPGVPHEGAVGGQVNEEQAAVA